MTEFVFLPPAGGAAPNKNLAEKPKEEPQQSTKDAGDEEFIFLPPSKNDAISSSTDRTAHDLTEAGGALAGAYTSRKFDPQSPANMLERNSSMGVQTVPMEYERSGLQRYLNSQLSPNLKISLGELEQVLGGEKIRTPSDVQNALKAIQEVKAERVGKTTSIDPVSGRPKKIYTTEAGRPAVDLSQFERKHNFINRAADEISDLASMAKGKLSSAGKIGIGGLGGALAGSQLYDAVDQYQKEGSGLHMPSGRNAAQFASGAGGALSTLPFGVTQAVGLALQAPELAYQGYEGLQELNKRRKQATREDVNNMLMNIDPMGNPMTEFPTQQSLPVNTPQAPLQNPLLNFDRKMLEEGKRAFPNKSATLLDY